MPNEYIENSAKDAKDGQREQLQDNITAKLSDLRANERKPVQQTNRNCRSSQTSEN